MEYIKLILGIALIMVFAWLLIRNIKRSGTLHSLFRIDTILGLACGFYLAITTAFSLLLQ